MTAPLTTNPVDEAVDAWHLALAKSAGLGAQLARDVLAGYPIDVLRTRAEVVATSDRFASDAFNEIQDAYQAGVEL